MVNAGCDGTPAAPLKINRATSGTFVSGDRYHCVAENPPGDPDTQDDAMSRHGPLMAIILVVEDEVFIRQAAEWAIEDMGHSPLMAEDLGSALAWLSADQPIDALFVDIRLNTLALGGYDVANQADGLRPGLRVLYTSGTPLTTDMSDRFVAEGRFIQKPYSPDQLDVAITSLLSENRVIPQPRGVTASTI
jgi:DNA-binding NtrC family response regulator